jgi:1-acyl-sn-glycerol-3-phosphate acyltransferase
MFYRFGRMLICVFTKLFYRFKVIGKENVSEKGRLILCANHTHILDPIFIAAATKRTIHFMAKKELFFWFVETNRFTFICDPRQPGRK